jgi:chloride channel protein, CIC family
MKFKIINILKEKIRLKEYYHLVVDTINFIIIYISRRFSYLFNQTILTTRPTIVKIGSISRYRHTDYGLIASSATVGIIIGIFVVIFHKAVEFAEEVFKNITFHSDGIIPWQIIIFPFIPAIGGLAIGIMKKTLFKGATIEGLDSLIQALIYRDGKIDWRNSFKSIFFAALSIGSGGGAGREGPTVVLGASLGSTIAQIFRLMPEQLRILCGSGAAAAISAIFNAPLGGIIFAMEAIIGETRIRTFVPLVISSVLATATARLFLGDNPLIITPEVFTVHLADYFLLAAAGMLSGAMSVYFLKAYYWTSEKTREFLQPFPEFLKPAIGGLMVGIILLILPTMWETTYNPINYVIAGKGMPLLNNSIFENIKEFFKGDSIFILWILVAAATVLIKPISNALTLASGGAGGTLAPVIKVGAMFGFCFGSILQLIFPDTSPGLYAIVCAGAALAGSFQMPLAGGIILFEICRNYDLILPLIFSSVFASFIVQKSGIRTFNPLQGEFVDDEEKLHPLLNFKKIKKDN